MNIHQQTLSEVLTSYPTGMVPDCKWHPDELSSHQHLTDNTVINNPHIEWNLQYLVYNSNLSSKFRIELLERLIEDGLLFMNGGRIYVDLPVLQYIIKLIDDGRLCRFTINKMCLRAKFDDESLDYLYQSSNLQVSWNCMIRGHQLNWMLNNYRPWRSELTKYSIENNIISTDIADRLVDLIPLDKVNYDIISYVSDPLKYLDILIRDNILNENRASWMLYESQSTQLTNRLAELYPNIVSNGNMIRCALDDDMAARILRDNLRVYNPHISDDVLYEFLIEEVEDSTIDNLVKFGRISTNRNDIRSKIQKIIGCYNSNKRYIDKRIIKTITDSDQHLGNTPSISAFGYYLVEGLENIQYKVNNYNLQLFINNIQELTTISESHHHLSPGINIIYEGEVDIEVLELISNCSILTLSMCWDHLSSKTHQDIIVKYPELPWVSNVLSSREYIPSKRFMYSKSANKV